jgi:hypothetical protein
MGKTNKAVRIDTVVTLALGLLYAGQTPGVALSTHVFELEGHTVLVAAGMLTVVNAAGVTKRIGL